MSDTRGVLDDLMRDYVQKAVAEATEELEKRVERLEQCNRRLANVLRGEHFGSVSNGHDTIQVPVSSPSPNPTPTGL